MVETAHAGRLKIVSDNGHEITYPKVPKYTPSRGHVLVRKRERGTSDGGIHIVDAAPDARTNMAKSLREGEVVLIGAPRYFDNGTFIPMDLNVGDIVLYSEPAGLQVDLNDPDMVLLFEQNCLCKRIV